MPIDYITGEEYDDLGDVGGYQELGPPTDLPTPPGSREAVMSGLASMNPQPQPQYATGPEFSVPVSRPGGPLGAAAQEYYSGRPGLFVQGGPTVPRGEIMVDGRLERSTPTGQGLPWWIAEADRFKEEQRQQDQLLRFMRQAQEASPHAEAGAAMEKAQRLQGQLQLQSDLRAGVPYNQALARSAHLLYPRGVNLPRTLATLSERSAFKPGAPIVQDGARLLNVAPGRFVQARAAALPKSTELTPQQKLQFLSNRERSLNIAISNANYTGDTKRAKELTKDYDKIRGEISELLQPAKPSATVGGATTAGPIRVRNKKTGVVRMYSGSAKDLADDPNWELAQ